MKFAEIQNILLDIAQERVLDKVLKRIVDGLASHSHIALARIWLVRPGDICTSCLIRKECPNQRECLHLVASQGASILENGEKWDTTKDEFQRFPFNVRKIGHIGGTGKPVLIKNALEDQRWIVRPQWIKKEGIHSFAGQPLLFREKVLGVLAVFSRKPLNEADARWLRVLADHVAVAIANAKAFEEIEDLRKQLKMENAYLREEIKAAHAFGDIVGESSALEKVLEQIKLVSPSEATVLILGESGVGKELVARAIHEHSKRRDKPMIKVNCGAIPKELFESEFFGHVKGAFTGALKDRAGRFQMADGGTLFLDEVGEIPLSLQSKLLRVIQEGQFERVGEDRTRNVDVRIIAATNQKLLGDPQQFRQDLYYRLSVFPIDVPPLRERLEDIPLLAPYFMSKASHCMNCPPVKLTARDIVKLQNYHWPGNIRELQNVIERAVITARHGNLLIELKRKEFPISILPDTSTKRENFMTQKELEELEYENLRKILEETKGKISGERGAAELLGVKPTTLFSRLKKLGLEKKYQG